MATNTDPSTPSSAYKDMEGQWCMIDDIMAGPLQIRKQAEKYLPKYEAEGPTEYQRRLASAPWRPEFVDALESLASKPFGKEVSLADGASPRIKELAEDIDGRGNNLTAFSRGVFKGGVAKGMNAILVDYPTMAPGVTLADERKSGARPYWVNIRAEDIIALYTAFVGSKEIVTHVRIRETEVVRDGYGEACVKRIRVLEPGRWELWEERTGENKVTAFEKIAEGRMTLPLVPLALFWTGEREGSQKVKPPLLDLADIQIELYRKLSRQDEIETYAGSPMLEGKGIAPDDAGQFQVGPKRILLAPPGIDGAETGWSYIQPEARNLEEIRNGVTQVVDDMRRLGMQPMTQRSGGVTATATSVESAKSHSVLQAWALGLKDAIEQAFVFTAQWLGEATTTEVDVNTDFSVDMNAQAPLDALDKARARGDIGHRDYLYNLRRLGVIAPDADIDQMMDDAIEEMPGDPDEEDIAAAMPPVKRAA
jgi:hypothetical protein